MRLTMIAHAETEATRAARFPVDEPLNPRGRAATAALARHLPRFDQAWSSPALAARDTAACLATTARLDDRLADLDCGLWCGKMLTTLCAEDPVGAERWLTDPDYVGHGGMSIAALLQRVATWMADRSQDASSSLAVTHAAVLRCAILAVTGAPPAGFWAIDAAPLTMAVFSSNGRRWTVRELKAAGGPADNVIA